MKTEIVSFYSDVDGGTYYSDHAKRLIKECEKFNLPYDIQEKPSLGTYQKNCLSKPQYIYNKLMEKRKPFVWLDIDTYILREPVLFDAVIGQCDIAFASSTGDLMGVKASPIVIQFNENVSIFLENWILNAQKTIELGANHFDHEPLFGLIAALAKKMKFGFLDEHYCVWPKNHTDSSVLMMGLSDVESKKENLRKMGMSEGKIEWQSTGTI